MTIIQSYYNIIILLSDMRSLFYNLIRYGLFMFLAMQANAFGKEMSFHILYMMQTNIIVADGEINKDTPEKFQKFLDTSPFDGSIYIVALNSDGGNLNAGLKLGRLIRKNKLDTTVAKYPYVGKDNPNSHNAANGGCFSSCALAFLGGRRRFIKPDDRLGFHQFSRAKSSIESMSPTLITQAATQLVGADILDYIVDMGVNPLLYSNLSRSLPAVIFIPDADLMRDLNILTKTEFDRFHFEPYKNGVVAYSEFPENVFGRNLVGQITTYCRKNTPYLLLSLPKGSQPLNKELLARLESNQNGFKIFSHTKKVTYDAAHVRVKSGGLPIAEIKLDHDGAQLLIDGALGAIEVGAVNGSYYFETKPNAFDKRKIMSSFQLCIE